MSALSDISSLTSTLAAPFIEEMRTQEKKGGERREGEEIGRD